MHRTARNLALLACLFSWPAMAGERGVITVVTHIDVIPTFLDQAVPVLDNFASDSKSDPGVMRFDLIALGSHYKPLSADTDLQLA